jgi:hypothetical protein
MLKCIKKIDAAPILEFILSMNVHNERIVGAGRNGKICVWNMDGKIELIIAIAPLQLDISHLVK